MSLGVAVMWAAGCSGSGDTVADNSGSCPNGICSTAGSSGNSGSSGSSGTSGGLPTVGGSGGAGGGIVSQKLVTIVVEPATVQLSSLNGAKPEQVFTIKGTYENGSTVDIPASTVDFSLDPLSIGGFTNESTFQANGLIGGSVVVTATLPASTTNAQLTAKASISVTLEKVINGMDVPVDASQHFATPMLKADPMRAAGLVYPLNDVVFPQNVFPADIQWTEGVEGDIYRITLSKPHSKVVAYIKHSGAGFGLDWLVDGAAWRSIAQSDPDSPAEVKVDRWIAASDETIVANSKVNMKFARAALTGSVYYWAIANGRILRIDDGTGKAIAFMPDPPKSINNESCVGCHSVSPSGRYMIGRLGGGENIGAVFDLTQDLTTAPVPTLFPLKNNSMADSSLRWWMSSWNPDDTRMVLTTDESTSRQFVFADPFAGTTVPVTGTLPSNATHPSWSPDGKNIAYVSNVDSWGGAFKKGDIFLLPVVGPDAVGDPIMIHQADTLQGMVPVGSADSYPTWTPDSKQIAFANGTGCRSDSDAAALYIMKADGTGVTRLLKAGAGEMTTDNFQPRFSPFDQGGYYWMSFLSRREYGNSVSGTKGTTRQQIWVTAIKKNPLPGEDPSEVSFWLSGQEVSSQNISAFWAPRPCRKDGEGCSVGSECCGGDCRPDSGGTLVCSPPPPDKCRKLNETCSTSGDCCNGLTCIGNVCVSDVGAPQ
jgi:hypothetical protein